MSDKTTEIVGTPQDGVVSGVDNFSQGLQGFLEYLGLPTENVLVHPDERRTVINNLPSVIARLSPEVRSESMYLSKFIAACGAGLFDAALNMIWNEVVMNLRQKVVRFDMEYFLDSVVTDAKRRATFKSDDDLKKLEEWELIKGCKDTGIITEIGYKHLDYIRDMRNHASAAHPNQNDLDGLQLASWLQTCIREVLAKEPEGPVLEVKRLLHNLRNHTLSSQDVPPIRASIQRLPQDLVDATLRAVYGMYTTLDLDARIRNNLKLIAPSVWDSSSKSAKYDAGLKYAVFSANADLQRKQLAYDFLTLVDGLSFLPNDQRALDMDQILDGLFQAHNAWNNFYNEPSHARMLAAYVPNTGDVPQEVVVKYVKVLTMCRIGNGYGVSEGAKGIYDDLLSRFGEHHFLAFVQLLWDSDVQSRLQFGTCAKQYKKLASYFAPRAVNAKLKSALEAIQTMSDSNLPNASKASSFVKHVESITL
jgi:hypothetical protein